MTVLQSARADPVGFLRGVGRVVIDEVQRASDLLLTIKSMVDRDNAPGRFLLTGSANLMTMSGVADSLAGRMETIELLPLSQSEIVGNQSNFLDNAFAGKVAKPKNVVVGENLVETVLKGGYPEALTRKNWFRRQDWHRNYAKMIVQRDVCDIARIERLSIMPKLLDVLAEHSGQPANYSGLGNVIGLNHVTTRKYLGIFESLFLVHTLQPWFTNRLKRLTRSPKLHFLDSGLLAALRNVTPDSVRKDKTPFGPILETFVFAELQKIATWSDQRCVFSHYRDKDKNEVDVVIENHRRQIVGIGVKASATVSPGDFAGMRKLAAAAGDRFVLGLVLYDHDRQVPFGENMMAVPLSSLM